MLVLISTVIPGLQAFVHFCTFATVLSSSKHVLFRSVSSTVNIIAFSSVKDIVDPLTILTFVCALIINRVSNKESGSGFRLQGYSKQMITTDRNTI